MLHFLKPKIILRAQVEPKTKNQPHGPTILTKQRTETNNTQTNTVEQNEIQSPHNIFFKSINPTIDESRT